MKAKLFKLLLIQTITALAVILGVHAANAQRSKVYQTSKKDTIAVFGSHLKITLTEGSFEKLSAGSVFQKYNGLFNLHDVTNSSGFVLQAKDTLVFYLTSVERPIENDGGISTWKVIDSFLDKAPSYRLESGWSKLGRDYLYFVKLMAKARPDAFFEFNFFFIENKMAFSLLQRPIDLSVIANESFTFISPR